MARPADQLPVVATRGASEAVFAVGAAAAVSTSLWLEAGRRFRRHHLAMVGSVILVAMVVAVLAGPLVWRYPINEIDFKAKLEGPSWSHPLGTDDLGQDLLARMLYGGRISLAVGIAAMLIAISIGTTIGATSGFVGGKIDNTLMRITDMFLSLREKEFVEAARGLGAPAFRQMFRHLLPNSMGPVLVAATIDVAAAIIAESTLSFLGLGFPPDIPTWGRILFDAKDNLDFAPHWAIFPGTAIFLTVLSINYIGDALRDALDPRKVLGR